MPAIARIPAIADVLGEVPIFSALTGDEREELASHMRVRNFARDEVIFHRDDPAGHFFAIVAGTVKLTAHDDAGREVAIAILRGGDVFGELELFDADIPRSVTVTAITETQALALDRRDFFDVLERHPRAMRLMLTSLARTIRDTARRIEDLVFLDLPSRVAKALLDLRTAQGNGEIHLTQDDIAAFVGATRASVNRVLSDLEGQGIVAIGRRHIEIKDLTRLQRQVRY